MADKELKPKSFRIDDLTAERFRKIAEETGGNQQQTLSRLIDIYEAQKTKEELPQKRNDIEQMDEYLQAVRLKYLSILADNVHQEEIIKAKLAARMGKQDAEIEELKQQTQEAKQIRETMASEIKTTTEVLNQTRTELQNVREQLADKEKLNQELRESRQKLQESYISLQSQIKAMQETRNADTEKINQTQRELADMQNNLAAIQKEKRILEDQLEQEKIKLQMQEQQAEIHLDRALLMQEKTYQEQIRQLTADNLAEVSRYQQMYRELLNQMKEQAASAAAEQSAGAKPAESEAAASESQETESVSSKKEMSAKES